MIKKTCKKHGKLAQHDIVKSKLSAHGVQTYRCKLCLEDKKLKRDINTIDNGFRQKSVCPHCFHEFNRATNFDDLKATPSPGDFSICIQCVGFACFNDAMDLVKVSENVLDEKDKHYITLMCEAIKSETKQTKQKKEMNKVKKAT